MDPSGMHFQWGHNPSHDLHDEMQEISGIQAAFSAAQRGVNYESDSASEIEQTDESSEEDSSESESAPCALKKEKKISPLLHNGFLYSGHLVLIGIPGAVLLLMIGSNALLVVIAFGGLAVYLTRLSGMKDMTTVSFLLTFICSHLVIMYSSIPLLWKSLSNIFLILCINSFAVLSGGWIILGSQILRVEEVELLQFMEVGFIAMYPVVCVLLMSCEIVLFTSVKLTPYCLMVLGFIILQPSLVIKSTLRTLQSAQTSSALPPPLVATIALIFITTVPLSFLVIQAFGGVWTLISVRTMVETSFLGSTSIFLATFFNLRQFFEIAGVDYTFVKTARWASGITSVLLISPMLSCYGLNSTLLPCLLGFMGSLEALSAVLIRKNKVNSGFAASARIVVMALVAICYLPWNIVLPSMDVMLFKLLLVAVFVSAVSSLLCVYASKHFTRESFGLMLLGHSLCIFFCESVMKFHDLFPPAIMALTSIAAVYLSVRLFQTQKLPRPHSLVTASFHCASCIQIYLPLRHQTWTDFCFHFLLLWLLCAMIAFVFLFQTTEKLSNQHMAVQAGSLLFLTSVNVYTLSSPVSSSVSAHIGLAVIVAGVCLCKWHLFQQLQWTKSIEVLLFPALLVLVIFAIFQPSFTWAALHEWILVLCLAATVLSWPLLVHFKKLRKYSCLLGAPVGFALDQTMFADLSSSSTCFHSVLCAACCIDIAAHLCWTSAKNEKRITTVSCVLIAIGVLGCVVHILLDADHSSPSILLTTISFLWSAASLKIWSLGQQVASLSKEGISLISNLPIVANVLCVLSFAFLLLVNAVAPFEVWVSLSAVSLQLLQNDHKLLRNLRNHNQLTPLFSVISLTLLSSSIVRSSLWTSTTWMTSFLALLEVTSVILSSPVLLCFIFTLWKNTNLPNFIDKAVVFLAPVSLLLFFVWSSYSSICLVLYVIATALWTVNHVSSVSE